MAIPFKRTYEKAEDLLRDAESYFEWCDRNPIRGHRTITNDDGAHVTRDDQYPRPYTFEGLARHIDIADWDRFKKNNCEREGFAEVFAYIRNRVRQCQIEGSLVGLYREGLTARLNGIADNLNISDKPPIRILDNEQDDE